MNYKRILSIQDISCFGQCSQTVALPIISACGHECCILPSAVLSTHTAGFTGFTVRDLTDDFPAIFSHWKKENIKFDIIYTGYIGTIDQIESILSYYNSEPQKPLLVVDPAMADNGKLYPAFDLDYVAAMRKLCAAADIILPNKTELDFLFGEDGKSLVLKEDAITVLTGSQKRPGYTGVEVFDKNGSWHYEHELLKESRHGTGDIYSSAFVGSLASGKSIKDSARIAADFTLSCLKDAQGDSKHFYGVKFEPKLRNLIEMLS